MLLFGSRNNYIVLLDARPQTAFSNDDKFLCKLTSVVKKPPRCKIHTINKPVTPTQKRAFAPYTASVSSIGIRGVVVFADEMIMKRLFLHRRWQFVVDDFITALHTLFMGGNSRW